MSEPLQGVKKPEFKIINMCKLKLMAMVTISLLLQINAKCQKYYSKDAKVSFYSKAPLENIEAHNYKGACIIEQQTGMVTFSVLMKGFEFAKGLMQDHFNENYVESDKYPKATFVGVINEKVPLVLQDGKHVWKVSGSMTLHGITKPLVTEIKVSINKGVVVVETAFGLNIIEYGIKIPSIMEEKISEKVQVIVSPTQLQKL